MTPFAMTSLTSAGAGSRDDAVNPSTLGALKRRLHAQFLQSVDAAAVSRLDRDALTEQVRPLIASAAAEDALGLNDQSRRALLDAVVSEIIGFGPLDPLLADPGVTEIMVNGPDRVYVERDGRLARAEAAFDDGAHILRIMERIVAPLGRRIDESSPLCDARLPDGSRVNCIISPLVVGGPALTIRKFARQPYVMDDLVRLGTLTPPMARFLGACVQGRLNILVSGGTGSGKTTLLNALSSFIPPSERIITIEDAAELQLQQAHVVALESRPANLEGRGEITIRHLLRNALRMRPDRIIVGEVRGAECLDMLAAMNTGHDGSLSTAHANTPRDLLSRLETMALMAGTELPSRALREQIASAVHLIVHQSRLPGGRRRITHIAEVQGIEGDRVILQDVFRWEPDGVDREGHATGRHCATGTPPGSLAQLTARGISLPPGLFG